MIGLGVLIGLAATLILTRVIQNLLWGISAADPVTYTLSIAALAGVAFLACYLPARRALKIDPVVALRLE